MSAMIQFKRRLLSGLSTGLSHARRLATNNKANISILAGITFIPFTIAVTAAVDLSNAIRIKSSLQAAADAGVLAAATALASGYGDSDKTKIATETFFANISPELMAAFPADPEVIIDFTTRTVHMDVTVNTDQLLTNMITDAITIGVDATATADQGSPVCLMAINPHAWKSLNIQGTADVNAIACAVQVNSDHEEAMRQNGGGQATAEAFCVHGNYSGENYEPMPRRHCMREQDPLAAQFAEDMEALDIDSMSCKGDYNKVQNDKDTVYELNPGLYCDGLEIKQGTVELRSGIHVFKDYPLEIAAHGSLRVEAGGSVTILFTGGPEARFRNQAGANVDVTAPSSGLFSGIVMASDPATIPTKENTIIGGGYMEFDGIIYYPTQPLYISGNGDLGADSAQFAILADTIDIEGNGTLYIHISSDAPGSGLPGLPEGHEIIRLIE
ncbi:MAG: pilus assembly protein TadG-related protein [Hyphomicrobiales bacterium]